MSGVSPVPVEWFHGLAWGCWCGRDHGLGCPVGMSGSGMGMLLGSRTATPQRLLWCGSMPTWSRPVPFGAVWKRVARGGLRTG